MVVSDTGAGRRCQSWGWYPHSVSENVRLVATPIGAEIIRISSNYMLTES